MGSRMVTGGCNRLGKGVCGCVRYEFMCVALWVQWVCVCVCVGAVGVCVCVCVCVCVSGVCLPRAKAAGAQAGRNVESSR